MMVTVASKIEHIEEIADGRAVERHIGVIFIRDRIRQFVSGARGQRPEPPIALDEFQDRNMIVMVCTTCPPRENGETTMNGTRTPSPKKSSGWIYPESQQPPPSSKRNFAVSSPGA